MNEAQTLFLCMGSACHQRRGYGLLPILEELIRENQLSDQLELKGAFCLENCQHGCSVKFDGRVFTGLNDQNIREFFAREIRPPRPPH